MGQLVEEVRKLGIVEHAACTTTHQKAAARANTHSKRQELTVVLKHKVRERLEARVLEMEQAKGAQDVCCTQGCWHSITSGVSVNDSEGRIVHNIKTHCLTAYCIFQRFVCSQLHNHTSPSTTH